MTVIIGELMRDKIYNKNSFVNFFKCRHTLTADITGFLH